MPEDGGGNEFVPSDEEDLAEGLPPTPTSDTLATIGALSRTNSSVPAFLSSLIEVATVDRAPVTSRVW
jgi:hypothetical protein